MNFLRRNSSSLILLLLIGMFCLVLDLYDEHDACAKSSASANQCCVQCCPSHNMGTFKSVVIKLSPLALLRLQYKQAPKFHYQDPFLDGLNRPPSFS